MSYQEFIAGITTGVVKTILGHPLDTLRTLKQNNMKLDKIVWSDIYRGINPALIQSSLLSGTVFTVNEYLYNYNKNSLLSGALSGTLVGLLTCPLDQTKIAQQVNLIKNESLVNFIKSYRNLNIVLLKDVPTFAIYFSSYKYLKQYQFPYFLAGGISGCLTCFLTYPLSTVKTRVFSGLSPNIYQGLKLGNLYSGLKIAMFRAFFVNGSSFYIYEYSLKILKKNIK